MFFVVVLFISCGCTMAACIIRFSARSTGDIPYPYDSELLAIASLTAFAYLLYYLRCFTGIGPLAIVVIQMLLKDVARILVIYACFLGGFAVAIHAVIFSDGYCKSDDYCSATDTAQTAASFVSIPKSLLSTVLMIMANFDLDAFFASRTIGERADRRFSLPAPPHTPSPMLCGLRCTRSRGGVSIALCPPSSLVPSSSSRRRHLAHLLLPLHHPRKHPPHEPAHRRAHAAAAPLLG